MLKIISKYIYLYIHINKTNKIIEFMKFKNPFPIFILITILFITSIFSSCEVEHFYDAEITVISSEGIPLSSMNVECVVDINDGNLIDFPSAVTNSVGKVNFSFDNIAILKVKANSLDTSTFR